jgi:hypothetical protein
MEILYLRYANCDCGRVGCVSDGPETHRAAESAESHAVPVRVGDRRRVRAEQGLPVDVEVAVEGHRPSTVVGLLWHSAGWWIVTSSRIVPCAGTVAGKARHGSASPRLERLFAVE